MQKLKAQPLTPGARIGIVAPASPVSTEAELETAVLRLEGFGFKAVLGKSITPRAGYLSGNDRERVADLEQMWGDDSLDAIWCLRGGYGTIRLLPYLCYPQWARCPKVLVGFSDITALEWSLWTKIKLISFHGPVLTTLTGEFSRRQAQAILSGANTAGALEWPGNELSGLVTFRAGRAQGLLLGGNLATLVSLLGTPYFPDLTNVLLFIEEINEAAYRIDRMLTQLRHSGVLDNIAGILVGQSIPVEGETQSDLITVFRERLVDLPVPVAYGWPIGHLNHQWTLPQGVLAEMETVSGSLQLCETPFAIV
ncbi:MAG TPA: LD-carboxypeptidase [Bacillota bacterium]|nr:LD-carboxypeptidase [Bacillota bacterium]